MRKVFVLTIFILMLAGVAYSEVDLGWVNLSAIQVKTSDSVIIPVFIKFNSQVNSLYIWREVQGEKFYCKPTDFSTLTGVLIFRCAWQKEVFNIYSSSTPPDYANFAIYWKEDKIFPYDLHICVNENDCASAHILVSSGFENFINNVNSEGNSNNSTNKTEKNAEEQDNQRTNTASNNQGFLLFLSKLRNLSTRNYSGSLEEWNGYNPSEGSNQSCDPSEIKLSPSSFDYTLRVGESKNIIVKVVNGCGERICNFDLVNNGNSTDQIEYGNWLVVEKEVNDCDMLKLDITASSVGEYSAEFTVKVNSTSLEGNVNINVVPGEQDGGYLYLEKGHIYTVDIPRKSFKRVYFYGCSDVSSISFYIGESSSYGYGVIEPVVKFIGNDGSSISSDSFPSWDDYDRIKQYLYEYNANYCPRSAGYEGYYYCMTGWLTKLLYLNVNSEESKCGWWVATLFNNSNESRGGVSLEINWK